MSQSTPPVGPMPEMPDRIWLPFAHVEDAAQMPDGHGEFIEWVHAPVVTAMVQAERDRCERIVQAARSSDIDTDFRTIAHFVRSGDQMLFNAAAGVYEHDGQRADRELSEQFTSPSIAVEIDADSQESHFPHCVERVLPGATPALVKPLNWGKARGRKDRWLSRGAAADMYAVYRSPSSSGWCLTICGKLLEKDFDSDQAAREHAAEDWARRMGEAVQDAPGDEAPVAMADALGQGANIYGEPGLFKIRPLTWIDFDGVGGVELANGYGKPIARFTIFRDGEGRIRWKGSVGAGGVAGSVDEAKRGAQADFNAWVAEAFIPVERMADLDERMKALGMIPISELLKGDGPLERFTAHAGVQTIDHFREWAEKQLASYMRMQMGYELGDQSMDDGLYEWVLAHAGVYGTVMANLRAVARRSGEAA